MLEGRGYPPTYSVQLRHVTNKNLTLFSLDCELIVQVLEHAVLSSCIHMKEQSKHYVLNAKNNRKQ